MQMSSDLQVRKRVVHLEQEVVSRRVILSLFLPPIKMQISSEEQQQQQSTHSSFFFASLLPDC